MRKKKPIRSILLLLVVFAAMGGWIRRSYWVSSHRSGDIALHIPDKPRLRFFILGDTGTGDASQYQVAAAMEARCLKTGAPDGIWLLGDLFYHSGVKDLADPQWKTKVEIPYGSPCLQSVPLFPILGNHDYRGNVEAMIAYSKVNSRWHLPGRFYTVDFGSTLRLVGFDSAFPDFCGLSDVCSVDYLRKQIATSTATWNLVMAHNPLSSASAQGYSHSGGILGFLLRPMFCTDQVHGWFSGHAHHMEYRQLASCPTPLFLAGGGGGDLYEVVPSPESRFLRSEHGFLEVEVSADDMSVEFYDIQGESFYRMTQHRK